MKNILIDVNMCYNPAIAMAGVLFVKGDFVRECGVMVCGIFLSK